MNSTQTVDLSDVFDRIETVIRRNGAISDEALVANFSELSISLHPDVPPEIIINILRDTIPHIRSRIHEKKTSSTRKILSPSRVSSQNLLQTPPRSSKRTPPRLSRLRRPHSVYNYEGTEGVLIETDQRIDDDETFADLFFSDNKKTKKTSEKRLVAPRHTHKARQVNFAKILRLPKQMYFASREEILAFLHKNHRELTWREEQHLKNPLTAFKQDIKIKQIDNDGLKHMSIYSGKPRQHNFHVNQDELDDIMRMMQQYQGVFEERYGPTMTLEEQDQKRRDEQFNLIILNSPKVPIIVIDMTGSIKVNSSGNVDTFENSYMKLFKNTIAAFCEKSYFDEDLKQFYVNQRINRTKQISYLTEIPNFVKSTGFKFVYHLNDRKDTLFISTNFFERQRFKSVVCEIGGRLINKRYYPKKNGEANIINVTMQGGKQESDPDLKNKSNIYDEIKEFATLTKGRRSYITLEDILRFFSEKYVCKGDDLVNLTRIHIYDGADEELVYEKSIPNKLQSVRAELMSKSLEQEIIKWLISGKEISLSLKQKIAQFEKQMMANPEIIQLKQHLDAVHSQIHPKREPLLHIGPENKFIA